MRVSDELTFVHEGDTPTLAAAAVCEQGTARYFWKESWASGFIDGAAASAITLPAVEKGGIYTCLVFDAYGNGAEICYEVVNMDAIRYAWSEDRSGCTASYGDASPEITENGAVSAVTVPPTCTASGKAVYTAVFTNPRFTAQTLEEELEPIGHAPAEAVRENETEASYDLVVYCGVCGAELSRETVKTGPTVVPGDVNGNGKVETADARLALRRAIGLEKYPEGSVEFLACDVTGDGSVGTNDARFILRRAIGLQDPGIVW